MKNFLQNNNNCFGNNSVGSSIFCIGLGKLGLMYSQIICEAGYKVYGLDKNIKIKNQILNNLKNTEPRLNYLINKNKKNFLFTLNYKKSVENTSACMLILPTPSKKNNEFDNSYIFDALKLIGKHLKHKDKYIINITSTCNPGSCELFTIFLEKEFSLKRGKEFIITYNPHLIALGSIYHDIINSDVVIIGSDISYGHYYLKKFYLKIYKKNLKRLKFVNLKEAEISKIAINAFVTMKISFSNNLSQLADSQNSIDVSKIIEIVGNDTRIGNKYLGLGGMFSGPCFPRDNLNFSSYLKKSKSNYDLPLAVYKINQLQIKRYTNLIKKYIKNFKRKPSIGICGIAYKDNTTLTEFSPGINIIKKFDSKNKIFVFDNKEVLENFSNKFNIKNIYNLKDFFNKSDIIIVCYRNTKFLKLNNLHQKNKTKIIIDLWNFLKIKNNNITYKVLGISKNNASNRQIKI